MTLCVAIDELVSCLLEKYIPGQAKLEVKEILSTVQKSSVGSKTACRNGMIFEWSKLKLQTKKLTASFKLSILHCKIRSSTHHISACQSQVLGYLSKVVGETTH